MVNRPTYERPGIVRHQMGWMNKFGRQGPIAPLTHIDGADVASLVERYGSPLFVFSERTLRARYHEVYAAFARRYPRVRLAWSYKTNYLEAICRVFHREGAWAEVVSPFEYEKAIRSGVPATQIHWNGPYKPADALRRAVAGGATIHLDNFDEMARVEAAARASGVRARAAIRVNMNIDGLQAWSRFGFNLETGQANDAAQRVLRSDAIDLVGLHAHIGTFVLDPGAYRAAAAKLAKLANTLRADHGTKIEFIDLGGGFASSNTLKSQYLSGEQSNPGFSRYADAICEGLADLDVSTRDAPTLVLETGRALVDDAGYLVTTVHANKRLPDGQRALVVDAGVNVLFTSFWYKHEVVPAQEVYGMAEPTVLYGPLCMNIDVVRDGVPLPPLSVGDRLVVRNVGAYNVTQWMQFIMLRPAVILIGSNGDVATIRRAETVDDVLLPEEVPPWME